MFLRDRRRHHGADQGAAPSRRRLRAVLVGVSAVGALAVTAPAAFGAVTVSPLPGTPDANPATQISILGTPASNIESVTVTGSLSGAHSGHLVAYDSAAGASYVLDAPFTEGEEANATVALKEGGTIEDRFDIARLGPPENLLKAEGEKPESLEHFKTEPGLLPPKVKINLADPSLKGDFFLDPLPAPTIHVGSKLLEFEIVGPNGLMLLNPEGKLLWWRQLPKGLVGSNLEKTTYEGRPAIAWWQGSVTETAYGLGEGVIANSAYEPVAHVKAGNGLSMDIHELWITPQGQAWIDAVEPVCEPVCDESHPPILDYVAQEIDINTGMVMWEWSPLGHVPLSETEAVPANGAFDPYHLNSIEPIAGDKVLISMRDTSGVYLLSLQDGHIIWQIAGKKSTYTRLKGTRFYFQHDAKLEGRHLQTLTVFDDEAGPPAYGTSRGLILHLGNGKVSLGKQYLRSFTTVAGAEGSMRVEKGGYALVGYGSTPFFSEFTKSGEPEHNGKLVFDAQLPKGDGNYRVLRDEWEGLPNTLPKLAAERESLSEVALYASWNGATNVASWQVLGGESPGSLAPLGSYAWTGFETKMSVASTDSTFEVQALDAHGHALASSGPVSAP